MDKYLRDYKLYNFIYNKDYSDNEDLHVDVQQNSKEFKDSSS